MERHGMTKTRLYRIWHGMKKRCYTKSQDHYENYGGRGIAVCPEWKDSFVAFAIWALQNGYREDLSIDRIDVNGNYEPSNCRWITMREQQSNKREVTSPRCGVHHLTFEGETHTVSEWAEIKGFKVNCLFSRIARGWDTEKILTTPVERHGRRIVKRSVKNEH